MKRESYGACVRNIDRVFKESDQVWPTEENFLIKAISDYESWSFYLVASQDNILIRPMNAKIELISGGNIVKTSQLTDSYLGDVSKIFPKPKARTAIWNHFSEPRALRIYRLDCTLHVNDDNGTQLKNTIEIPLKLYEQKTKLIFPLKGRFIVPCGHDYNEAHRWERS